MSKYLKKIIIVVFILGVTLSLLALGGTVHKIASQKSNEYTGTLYVNGQEIDDASVIFTEDYIAIPLLKVLKNINCDIQWIDSNSATIEYGESRYTLVISEFSLVDSSASNLIQPICGGKMYRHAFSADLVLDDATLRIVLHHIDPQLDIAIGQDNFCVIIEKKTD